jgi:hypothetical protein
MDGGGDWTVIWMCSIPQKCILKYGYDDEFHVMWILPQIFKTWKML